MSLMNSRESIGIQPITTDNLNQPVTTRHLNRTQIIVEQPKCQILHQILPRELIPTAKTLISLCLMQLVIGTELDLEVKLKIPIINKWDKDLVVHHQIKVDRWIIIKGKQNLPYRINRYQNQINLQLSQQLLANSVTLPAKSRRKIKMQINKQLRLLLVYQWPINKYNQMQINRAKDLVDKHRAYLNLHWRIQDQAYLNLHWRIHLPKEPSKMRMKLMLH